MTPEQLIQTVGGRTGQVPVQVALRAVRTARKAAAAPQLALREGDRRVKELSPDAILVIDASCCVVLVTPERRVTVTNLDAWWQGIDQARVFQRIYAEDAEQRAAGLP